MIIFRSYEELPEFEYYERFYYLPKKANHHEYHGNHYRDHWKDSWSKKNNYLNKVRLGKWVGRHADELVSKYINRLPKNIDTRGRNRTDYLLYDVFGLEKSTIINGKVYVLAYGNRLLSIEKYVASWKEIYHIDSTTRVIQVTRKESKPSSRREKSERCRMYAELAQKYRLEKRRYCKDKKKLLGYDPYWWEVMRRYEKEEKERTRVKMIAKGFDPDLSFRKHRAS